MSAHSYPDGARRIDWGQNNDDAYIFSDGAEPPRYVKVWYEGSPDEVTPGMMVQLHGLGSFDRAQLNTHLEGMNDNLLSDADMQERAAHRSTLTTLAELPMDPRIHGEDVAEEAALQTAKYIFALAVHQ